MFNPIDAMDSAGLLGDPSNAKILAYLEEKYDDTFVVLYRGKGASASKVFCASSTYPNDEFQVNMRSGENNDELTDNYQLVLARHYFYPQLEGIVHEYFPGAGVRWELGGKVISPYRPGDPFSDLDKYIDEETGFRKSSFGSTIYLIDDGFEAGSEEDMQQRGIKLIEHLRTVGLVTLPNLSNSLWFCVHEDDPETKGVDIPNLMWDTLEYKEDPIGRLGVRFSGWNNKEEMSYE